MNENYVSYSLRYLQSADGETLDQCVGQQSHKNAERGKVFWRNGLQSLNLFVSCQSMPRSNEALLAASVDPTPNSNSHVGSSFISSVICSCVSSEIDNKCGASGNVLLHFFKRPKRQRLSKHFLTPVLLVLMFWLICVCALRSRLSSVHCATLLLLENDVQRGDGEGTTTTER